MPNTTLGEILKETNISRNGDTINHAKIKNKPPTNIEQITETSI